MGRDLQRALSKAQIAARCSALLRGGPCRVNGDDQVFLLTEVFPRHENWATKRGVGVSHVEIRRHGEFHSCGFYLIRTDGSEVDISYRAALNGSGTQAARARSAARSEIAPQISSWKDANPPSRPGLHCDHIEPFDALWKAWLGHVEIAEDDISVTSQLVGHVDMFLERALAKSWQAFHRRHARFQWLGASENIAKANKPTSDHSDWLADYERAEQAAG